MALAGCTQAPEATTTAARQAAALEANRKGETYVRHGELENAARSYTEALRLSQSLEDAEGIAANAINLSIVRQRQGRFADARAALGAVTEQRNLRFSPLRLTEAALRHALLDLDERRFARREEWVDEGRAAIAPSAARSPARSTTCARSWRCRPGASTAAAAARARAGRQPRRRRPRRARQRPAPARHHRVAQRRRGGRAHPARAGARARPRDRRVAQDRLDLLALGRAAALGGDRDGARAYYGRALAVSEADRDSVAAAEARALLEAVDKAARPANTTKKRAATRPRRRNLEFG